MILRQTLSNLRNTDGGWGYYPDKQSRLEPTCWALLALARDAGTAVDAGVLDRWPRRRDWLIDAPGAGAPVNYAFNAVAGLTLLQDPAGVPATRPIATALATARGLELPQSVAIQQNNSLQAWPWIDQTFSWVEPTAWCLIFLKKCRAATGLTGVDERIRVGEQVLFDRVCAQGGWNYGSSNVYGQELYPFVPTSALGLLALQDHRDHPAAVRTLAFLRTQATSEPSAMALSMAAIGLRTFGAPADGVDHALSPAADFARSRGNVLGMAMSLYALADARDGMAAFAF